MRQLMKSIGALAAVMVLAAGISQVAAHHSASMFDFSRTVTMKGFLGDRTVITDSIRVKNNCNYPCLLYTSPSPRDRQKSRMPSSA